MRMFLLLTIFMAASVCSANDQDVKIEYNPGDVFRDCEDCPEMVVIPPGEFVMGPHPKESHTRTFWERQRVSIEYRFAVGRFELLSKEYLACVSAGGCSRKVQIRDEASLGEIPAYPLSWNDAQSYVSWLSKKTGEEYRLLSASEWEYVARAGKDTVYWWGDEFKKGMVVCRGCFEKGKPVTTLTQTKDGKTLFFSGTLERFTRPVGGTNHVPPNPFGVFYMLGNASEWVEDCLSSDGINYPNPAKGTGIVFPVDGSPIETNVPCKVRITLGSEFNEILNYGDNQFLAIRSIGGRVDDSTNFALSTRIARKID